MERANLYRRGKIWLVCIGIFILSIAFLFMAVAISDKASMTGFQNWIIGTFFLSPIIIGFLLLRYFGLSRARSWLLSIGIILLSWLIVFGVVMILMSSVQC